MTTNHAYEEISKAMSLIENLNLYESNSRTRRMLNQQQLNKAYRVLDNFRDELIRENIKNKQKRGGTNDRYKNT